MKMLIASAALLFGSTAFAGPISDCYADANSDNPGLSMTVSRSGSTILRTSNTAALFQTVARFHTDSTLAIGYNSAGEDAIEDTMACIWSEGYITLSSVWVNENVSGVQIHPTTMRADIDGTVVSMTFKELGVPCHGENTDALVFEGGGNSVSVAVQSNGLYDWKGVFEGGALACGKYSCTGGCYGESSQTPPYDASCYCDSAQGKCAQHTAPGIGGPGYPNLMTITFD